MASVEVRGGRAVDAPVAGAVSLEGHTALAGSRVAAHARVARRPARIGLDGVAHGPRLSILDGDAVAIGAHGALACNEDHLEPLARDSVAPGSGGGRAGERRGYLGWRPTNSTLLVP